MAQRRITCKICPRFDPVASRCRDGKPNPRLKADALMVAQLLGVRALCCFNTYREPLINRMYHPAPPAPPVLARLLRRGIHIEIEETCAPTAGEPDSG